VLQMSVTVG